MTARVRNNEMESANESSRRPQSDGTKGLLRHWRARDAAQIRQLAQTASRHSRFVQVMKTSLPVVAVVIVAMAVGSALMVNDRGGISIMFPPLPTVENDLYMLSPSFSGFDSRDRPYTVNALTAVQDRKNPNLIRLTTIDGHVVLESSENAPSNTIAELDVTANGGLLRSEEQTMVLEGNVTLTSNNDYQFVTQRALVEFETNRISGSEPVAGTGPHGSVTAQEFEVTEDGDRILFKGDVQTTIVMDPQS